ncbi:MAG: alcohol dehydrogenase catalytic domain-containing protein [Blastocatellia bacterium]|nr:alcohol dehydrogenase catalytic domain-containing protein [Blastocatellia bacterium]
MRAAVIREHGGPEVLNIENVPDPAPRADQVLVEVRACALNHLDTWVRRGLPGMTFPMPHILGNDIAGVVEKSAISSRRSSRVTRCCLRRGQLRRVSAVPGRRR